jgi:hypothetical protein
MKEAGMEGWEGKAHALGGSLKEALKDCGFVGLYVVGSAALGDWHEEKSDIDFVCVTQRPPARSALPSLNGAMRTLKRRFPAGKPECMYVPEGSLGIDEGKILSFSHGRHRYANFNLNAVTWHTLKYKGQAVCGKPASELKIPLETGSLESYIRKNLSEYWQKRLSDILRPSAWALSALTDRGVEWCACGISRMAYALEEGDVASKLAAARYMLSHAPKRHAALLEEAISIRQGLPDKSFPSPFERKKALSEYMQSVICSYSQ